jgi:hypothetical protein
MMIGLGTESCSCCCWLLLLLMLTVASAAQLKVGLSFADALLMQT